MKKHRALIIYLVLYALINILILTRFPFVHSDEPWLSGLSRNMMQNGSLSVTETFFDLKPRFPHAIKSIFHLLQMPFILIFGYNIFALRLVSLLSGLGALIVFYSILSRSDLKAPLPLLGTILLSLDVQFIYASHFARQEILILLAMLGCYRLLMRMHGRSVLFAAILTGLSIGIHPNSFLIASLCGGLIAVHSIVQKRFLWKELCLFTGVVACFAAFFIALSFSFDNQFPSHYAAYSSEFQIDASLSSKFREIVPYFQRLFYRVSGTYYTPDIRFELLFFASLIVCGSAAAIVLKAPEWLIPLSAVAAVIIGMTVMGRFNQPYVVFFFPFCCLLLMLFFRRLPQKAGILAAACSCALIFALSMPQIARQASRPSYDDYLASISVVPKGAKTIGNLNAEFYFENGALLDYRNLPYLKQNGLTLEHYVASRGVEYLIISDELYLIYEARPVWNGIYGNINFLKELDTFLERKCTLLREFTDNQYGLRVVSFQNSSRKCNIRIYRVN